ncbi:glycoprotein hormone beta-5 [Aulostomus maculatus]
MTTNKRANSFPNQANGVGVEPVAERDGQRQVEEPQGVAEESVEERRRGHLLCGLLLWISLQPDSALPRPSAVNLRRFIGCAVREFTFQARKPGCGGLQITTDACWGRCETWEKPVLDPPFIESYQRVCTYNETRLVTVKLPNCQPHVDPTYTYPVALRCDCGVCQTSTTECITSV